LGLEHSVVPGKQSPPPPARAPQTQELPGPLEPQGTKLEQDAAAQLGFVQMPLLQAPLGQMLPQVPQLLASVCRSGPDVAVAIERMVVVGVVVSVAAISCVWIVVTVMMVEVKAVEVEVLVEVAVLLTTIVTVGMARERHSQALVICVHS
jgi:hypothetical protein